MKKLMLMGACIAIGLVVAVSLFRNENPSDFPAATALKPLRQTSLASDEVLLDHIPFLRKKPDFAGEACVAMALQGIGIPADQDFVFDQGNVDPVLGRGMVTRELMETVAKLGFRHGRVWHPWNASDDEECLRSVTRQLKQRTPSIFCLRENGREKFVLVVGVDAKARRIIAHDPSRDDGRFRRWKWEDFFQACRLTGDQFVRLDLEQKNEIQFRPQTGRTAADYAQHVMKLRAKLPPGDFHIVLQEPFVVIGDEALNVVKRRSERTVKWAVDLLKKDYFRKDPVEIINVWLFKDKQSYETNCVKLFGSKPGTPYGYYSSQNRALVMNISTGGGTLVHEIVHPFIESNFPACPSWFNEGLASLYEQSSSRDQKIIGLTNWRLRGLQMAIKAGRLGTFDALCHTSRREFYDDPDGTHYSQARYLCYYLQEQGRLRDFYHRFRQQAATDPSGYLTLQKVLQVSDMEDFQKRWESWVMQLRFGN